MLKIAGMEISVVTDADSAIIEQSVGMVDRTIREIKLKSAGCSLTEAAILCALDANAERLALQEKYSSYETQVEADKELIEDLNRRINALTSTVSSLQEELDNAKSAQPAQEESVEPAKESASTEPSQEDQAPAASEKAPQEPVQQTRPPRQKNKSHVGSMFDLLTFDDV